MLGVGAAVTLAAWNDTEHGSATFTAGTFGIEGAVNGTAFSEHPTQAATATMELTTTSGTQATALTPGASIYALFSVRTITGSVGGTAQLVASAQNGTGLGQYMTYGASAVPSAKCDEASFRAGTPVLATGSALSAGSTTSQALQANAGTPVHYCFQFTLPPSAPNAAQGTALTARWEVVGTSS